MKYYTNLRSNCDYPPNWCPNDVDFVQGCALFCSTNCNFKPWLSDPEDGRNLALSTANTAITFRQSPYTRKTCYLLSLGEPRDDGVNFETRRILQ